MILDFVESVGAHPYKETVPLIQKICMGDDRIYDNDSPQQVLNLRTVLYTQALTGACPVISVKKFLIS